jgi:protein-ribulosamine 3-kinase
VPAGLITIHAGIVALSQIDWNHIAAHIAEYQGRHFAMTDSRRLAGGCINEAWEIRDGDSAWFVKFNTASNEEMFAAEAAALQAIADTGTVAVPLPLCHGSTAQHSYLVLEYLDLTNHSADGGRLLGEQLAALHRHGADRFGWQWNNTIGSTPQINSKAADWSDFWKHHRLGAQLELAAQNGYGGRLQQRGRMLLDRIDDLMAEHTPQPSLLHGDLWSGNYAYTAAGQPVIFDPASYYGDRETDLAMTELFGGFPPAFYQAYQNSWPLAPGYRQRKTLYNLYHVLNHLNLFGGAYLGQAESMIEQLLQH